MAALSNLSSIVESGRHACYGIEWQLTDGILVSKEVYNPAWRLEYAARAGLRRLFTKESTKYTFKPGEGLVGQVFEKQETTFVPDLQQLSAEDVRELMFAGAAFIFKRSGLAAECGIHSAVFVPTKTGVMEVGAMLEVSGPDELISSALIKAIKEGGEIPAVKPKTVELPPCPPWLQKVAESSPESCYAIEWAMNDAGALAVNESYNPAWRVQYASQAGLPGLFTTSSKALTFGPGEGVVGHVFQDQKQLFIPDVQKSAADDIRDEMFSGNYTSFLRTDLAKTFNIRSAAFVPLKSGVLELGSMKELKDMTALLTESAMKAIQESPVALAK
ncbi:Kidins220 [Symbiodinium pilosum]|uniref:Kidins220 protein n=1 Tax=Symbiodinium pilosum TaxID=2952 RepID=A0A812VF52_SYMPI|nr:Kidins220 [Symbiodinium pilosum]